ncbi:hypothetical protein CEW87_21770 [Parazoarcus communis]|uniref:PepSY domain-containing protein n=1 Tax=Parazoarcus communis TaxID=41977 RepID=A0A2U8HAF7_9RHOO|nr:PepSY domain-containing protein [Parazoarcus communis]AWI81745.1 hypothetical protein CEW87_21770 [Parazoarcus communis]
MRSFAARLVAILLVAGALLPASGGAPALASDAHDHDRARRALEAGEVMPLRDIIDSVEQSHPGQIIEIELERDDGRWLYELKLLRADGSMAKLLVDARDGRVLSVTGRRTDDERRMEGRR